MSNTTIIWNTLVNAKFKEILLYELKYKFQNWDRNINIFLAVASSTSIAAWTIWDEYRIVYAIIIAASQVVTVIKPYFNYNKYVNEIGKKASQLVILNIELERLWSNIESNRISDEDMNTLYYGYKNDLNKILDFNNDVIFKADKKSISAANIKMKDFLQHTYNIDIDINQ